MSRTIDPFGRNGRPRRWFCSPECSEASQGKPVHLEMPDWSVSACGKMRIRPGNQHRFTEDVALVSCGGCKNSVAYKKALNPAA